MRDSPNKVDVGDDIVVQAMARSVGEERPLAKGAVHANSEEDEQRRQEDDVVQEEHDLSVSALGDESLDAEAGTSDGEREEDEEVECATDGAEEAGAHVAQLEEDGEGEHDGEDDAEHSVDNHNPEAGLDSVRLGVDHDVVSLDDGGDANEEDASNEHEEEQQVDAGGMEELEHLGAAFIQVGETLTVATACVGRILDVIENVFLILFFAEHFLGVVRLHRGAAVGVGRRLVNLLGGIDHLHFELSGFT